MHKTKIAEPEVKMVETDKVELTMRAPNLSPENAKIIARDVRRTLENCGRLNLLNEFAIVARAEYAEVPVEEVAV